MTRGRVRSGKLSDGSPAGDGRVSEGAERRLAAIMFTDIVGFTALTERDEPTAIRVRERHRAIVKPLVEQFDGELVDATGDESLSVFPSAVLAVDCALAVQAALRQDRDLQLRIGIHLGDVVQRDGEVVGEGVNVAARIRPLAQPGGICISEPVQQMVGSHSHIRSHPLGRQALKNVERPVKVFTVATGAAAAEPQSRLRRWMLVAAGITTTTLLLYAAYVPNRAVVLSSIAIAAPRILGASIEQKLGFATTSDGVRIAYATTGEGSPVVFVLGWATHLEKGIGSPLYDSTGWISRISQKHLLVRYDGRGFGLSDRDVDDFSLEPRVRDLEAVVDFLGLERFAIYAISAGGPTAIEFAVRQPERVTHLILAGTTAGAGTRLTPEALQRWNGIIELFRTSWDSPIVRGMMTEFLAPDANDVEEKVLSEFLRVSGDGPAVAGFFDMLWRIDVRDKARTVRIPTLVIHGQEDPAIPLELGRDLASLIPGARFEILEGADHGEGTVRSPRISELIEEFLAESGPPRA
jgi:class 3 adenylate cyclase/pimeloyl-ACP methyl ester carboxylesterase